ncbi:MAG: helix-turn-helix domain-containing protein [bacterium]
MDTLTIKQTLFENGFTEKETELYLTSLQLGLAPISTIARHLHENRVTVYSTMKNLVTKGVAKSVTKSSTAYYSVISPQQLVEKISQKLHNLQNIVPDLLAITKKIDAPVKTQFFE